MDLVEFLQARLDEDEATAKDAAMRRGPTWCVDEYPAPPQWGHDPRPETVLAGGKPIVESDPDYGGLLVVEHIARHDPSRVLAEVEAKRKIIERHQPVRVGPRAGIDCFADGDLYPCDELRLLALPDADHPDYRPEWKP